jgi:hypothetical protein
MRKTMRNAFYTVSREVCVGARTALLIVILMFVGALGANGQNSGLSFMSIGIDAAAMARGDASTGSTSGAFATYWNPAALALEGKNAVGLSHHIWIDGFKTYAIATRFSTGKSSGLGLFITGTDSGDLEARDDPGPPTGTFQAQSINMGVSYGLTVGPLRLGASVKYITERIFDDSASGYAFDAGAHATFFNNGLNVGAVLQNVGEMNELRSKATELPKTFRTGIQFYPFRVVDGMNGTSLAHISISADVSHNIVDEISRVHIGADALILDIISLRLGFMTNDTLRGASTGIGLEIGELQFDYALIPFKDGFDGPAHILTLNYSY